MALGDGSPCEQMWGWIESKKFETKEEALEYLDQNGGNQHAYECVHNYPWPKPEERELVYHVYLEKFQNRDKRGRFRKGFSLAEYYHRYVDNATGRTTTLKDGDVIINTVEHIRS